MMGNIVFKKTLLTREETKNQESSVNLYVTRENNGYLVSIDGPKFIKWFWLFDGSDKAIDWFYNEFEGSLEYNTIIEEMNKNNELL